MKDLEKLVTEHIEALPVSCQLIGKGRMTKSDHKVRVTTSAYYGTPYKRTYGPPKAISRTLLPT